MNESSFLKISGVAITAILFLGAAATSQGAIATVSVVNDSFKPSSTSINVNDTVIWTWGTGSEDHNVTSTSSPKAWAWTASLDTDAPFSFTNKFGTAGSFPYECTVHASIGMVATVTVAAAANVPPTVTITSPAAGAVFRAPASVAMQVTASDSDATVTNVQFLNGTAAFATVTSAPFNATASNLAAGSYTLAAVATDTVGLKNTNSVSIIVDAPPTVTITNPVSGTVYSAPATVTIQAAAASSGGTTTNVQFLTGSTLVSNRTTAPYAATASNLAAGSYMLTAIAADNRGITTTNSVTLSVVTPVATTYSALHYSPTGFQFSFTANPGLSYVVQKTTNLTTALWVPVNTNQAAGNPVMFTDPQATSSPAFYRVGLLPNP